MLESNCPKCDGQLRWWPDDLFTTRPDKKMCVSCGIELQLRNSWMCTLINGIIFGLVTTLLMRFFFHYYILSYVIGGSLCWLTNPLIVRIFGRWQVSLYRDIDSEKIKKWKLISTISGWICGISIAAVIVGFWWVYHGIKAAATEVDTNIDQEYLKILLYRIAIGCALAIVARIVYLFAKSRVSRLRYPFGEHRIEMPNGRGV